ncbi:LacI family DNA-binding transcriptional regulator [Micromonospora sp. NPDC050200]|uniref:LacI family DNA-binding transcriptional regulator n=1 Tax=Micromonospora sp. NPDC050200 TaxID=3155664 RepID=UPI0033F2E51D
MPQAPTMRDVAERAGVSSMTVSRVLHGSSAVSADAKARVLAAVNELGYHRNEVARSLRLGRDTGLVGLVITNLANPFYSQLAVGVESVLTEHGIRAVLGNSGEDVEREREMIRDLVARRVDGIIVVPAGSDQSHLETVRRRGTPVVLGARPPDGVPLDCVLVDDFTGARAATNRLIDAGHQRIGFLGLPPATWTGSERFRGYCAALDAAGLPLDDRYVRRVGRDRGAAERAAAELLGLRKPPTALFSANNRNTIGAFRAIRAAGADTALAGFDDFELADTLGLPLTVVSYDAAEIGRQASRVLLSRMLDAADGGADAPPRRLIVPTTLIDYP